MSKRMMGWLALILLVACGPATPDQSYAPAETVDAAAASTPSSTSAATAQSAPATAAATTAATAAAPAAPPVSPAEAGIIREDDWTLGADEPLVTIIEYGDFQ